MSQEDGRNQEEQYSDTEEQSSSEMTRESPVDLAESRPAWNRSPPTSNGALPGRVRDRTLEDPGY
jgi:hypothetical protein